MKFLDDSAYIISIIKSALRTMTFTDVINARTDSNWNELYVDGDRNLIPGTSFWGRGRIEQTFSMTFSSQKYRLPLNKCWCFDYLWLPNAEVCRYFNQIVSFNSTNRTDQLIGLFKHLFQVKRWAWHLHSSTANSHVNIIIWANSDLSSADDWKELNAKINVLAFM